ncbi:hypothetical protein [Marinagarivorans cellulosilyticus]|uniref:hypothetical protein n=1 Tax=Marinagarivorans cellulosilyticus TaxID=2721545 RepID=UPI001F33B28F|nr:hypothetical protein [Marinagarivorans cellulosilyticus]
MVVTTVLLTEDELAGTCELLTGKMLETFAALDRLGALLVLEIAVELARLDETTESDCDELPTESPPQPNNPKLKPEQNNKVV